MAAGVAEPQRTLMIPVDSRESSPWCKKLLGFP